MLTCVRAQSYHQNRRGYKRAWRSVRARFCVRVLALVRACAGDVACVLLVSCVESCMHQLAKLLEQSCVRAGGRGRICA
eukprot:1174076-Pleurochrysis_carterae.AAC.1